MNGYTGKILRVNLTTRQTSTIDTSQYAEWAGGHGMAAAIFFDLVKDKTISCFDPKNVLVIMGGLFSGTAVPAAGRTEMVGIQAQSYPQEWFGRSNAGGRFSPMLKYAGYDGIVIEGASDQPVWINIIEGDVEILDADYLWGLDTWETQKTVYSKVMGIKEVGGFYTTKGLKKSTQIPSVLAIGPAGENKSRIASVMTEAGNAFGQGGFGGVWGSKNLKAISVWGTGGVEVADPKGLMDARLWAERNYGWDCENPTINPWQYFITSHFGGQPNPAWTPWAELRRSSGCTGCHLNCRPKTSTGSANGAICIDGLFYQDWDLAKHGRVTEISGKASDICQRLGINNFELQYNVGYLKTLYDRGVLGKGKAINTNLPVDKIGEIEFIEDLLQKIAHRREIGDDMAEGFPRAAERWGRIDEDLQEGIMPAMFWGYPIHYDTRTEVYWGYSSIVSDRDINCHDINVAAYWMPSLDIPAGNTPIVSAQQVADWFGELAPFHDSEMMNFATDNIYSIHMARMTAWILRYSRFWKQSCGLCDNAFADIINPYGEGNRGLTPTGELKFYKAVTGKDITFEESMEMGQKIFNLDKAIWTLQGRHRDMEKFPEYVYNVDSLGTSYVPGEPPSYYMPTKENGAWDYRDVTPRHLDETRFEEWKSTYYELEGWDPSTGRPKRAILESLGMKKVADELDSAGKLG